jgi:integrase
MPKRFDQELFENGFVQIYRRKPGGIFYSRIRHTPPQRGGQTLSLDTRDRDEAVRLALDRFRGTQQNELEDKPSTKKRIPEAVKAFSKHYRLEVDRGRVSFKWYELKLSNLDEWKAYLGKRPVDQIKQSDLANFEAWRTKWVEQHKDQYPEKRPTLSVKTLNGKQADLVQLLLWCVQQDWLRGDQVPAFKAAHSRDRRPAFSEDDYSQVVGSIDRWIADETRRIIVNTRKQIACYVPIMGVTGMRVGEARELKWKHIGPIENYGAFRGVKIRIPRETKTGTRELIAPAEINAHFEKLKLVYAHDWGFESTANDYVFCSMERRKRKNFLKAFNSLLRFADVLHNNAGEKYTIYSLRHFYATRQLRRGVPIYDLAKNMGTSVAMIEKHYSHVQADDVAERLIGD